MKAEERVRKILEEQERRNIDLLTEKSSSLVGMGVIIGIILSYSGILGFAAGFAAGLIVTNKQRKLQDVFLNKIINIFYGIKTESME